MKKYYKDPKFPTILRRFLQGMEWSASDLAARLYVGGRKRLTLRVSLLPGSDT